MVENSKKSVIKLLRNNKDLRKNDMKLLKKVSKKFPFFLPVKILKLFLAKKHQTIDYNKILKSSSINITDRVHLFNLTNNDLLSIHERQSLINEIKKINYEKEVSFLDWISESKPTPNSSAKDAKSSFLNKFDVTDLRSKEHGNFKKIKKQDYMTETLAKIYVNQHKYKDALKAYKILCLKYPEKISLFADQIKFIKKQIKNQ
tara:strand:+ start:4893 stop:5501 length:609 start_codon:yes stop_codon:yes gene_type:complete